MISVRLAFLFLALHSFIPPILGRDDKNQDACRSFLAVLSYCSSATPGFSRITAFSAEAPCLCYESATWKPQIYDGVISSCYDYYSTADPSFLSSLSSSRSRAGLGSIQSAPCSDAGDVLAGVTQKTASASAPLITTGPSAGLSRYDINRVACNLLDDVTSVCQSATPSFSRLSFSQQATCACYSGISWDPAPYDSLVRSCINYISTRNATAYSLLSAGGLPDSPCEDAGDILSFSNANPSSLRKISLSNRPAETFDLGGGAAQTTTSDQVSSRSTSAATPAQGGGSNSATPRQSATKTGGGSGVEVCSYNDVPPIWRRTLTLSISSANFVSSQASCRQV